MRERGGVFTGLIWVAFVLWLIAQALPAYAMPPDDFLCSATPRWDPPPTCDLRGVLLTLFGWGGFVIDVLAGAAWTANLFFVLALALRWARRPVPAAVCALAAATGGLLAIAVLEGAVGGAVDDLEIRSVGIGSWVWVVSMLTLPIGVLGWALAGATGSPGHEDHEAQLDPRRDLLRRVAIGFGALLVVVCLSAAAWAVVLELKPLASAPAREPLAGNIGVIPDVLPASIHFGGGAYRVESCAGTELFVDGRRLGVPPLTIELEAGDHEVDSVPRRCTITFIPTTAR